MSDFSAQILERGAFGTLCTASKASVYAEGALNAGQAFNGSSAWPAANEAILTPVFLPFTVTAYQLWWFNGATASGNVDAGIYDEGFSRLVSTGSTAQAGVSTIQVVDTADVTLPAGLYYLALALSSTTGTVTAASTSSLVSRASGVAQMASALPLPSTVTPVAISTSVVPLMGAAIETSVF